MVDNDLVPVDQEWQDIRPVAGSPIRYLRIARKSVYVTGLVYATFLDKFMVLSREDNYKFETVHVEDEWSFSHEETAIASVCNWVTCLVGGGPNLPPGMLPPEVKHLRVLDDEEEMLSSLPYRPVRGRGAPALHEPFRTALSQLGMVLSNGVWGWAKPPFE